jgi:hypothetical protein
MNENGKIKAVAVCALAAASITSWPAFAAATTLVCQWDAVGSATKIPFKVTLDEANRMVTMESHFPASAKFTHTTITFHGHMDEGTIDRLTGKLSFRQCKGAADCSNWFMAACHKGAAQF